MNNLFQIKTIQTTSAFKIGLLVFLFSMYVCFFSFFDILMAADNNVNNFSCYEVDGTVLFSGKKIKVPFACNFTMYVDGRRWKIRVNRSVQPDALDYDEIGWDGTNLFAMSSMVSSYKNWQGKKPENVAMAYIGTNEIYRTMFDPEVAMIWLTYGSRYYFQQKIPGDFLEPVISFDNIGPLEIRSEVPLYRATWKKQNQYPFLPLEVVYFQSQDDFGSFTNSIFRVSSVTNYAGVEYPNAATLETYQTYLYPGQRNFTTSNLFLFSKYELNLTAIKTFAISGFNPKPTLPGATFFVDERISSQNVAYTGNIWVAESSLKDARMHVYNYPKYSGPIEPYADVHALWKKRLVLVFLILLSVVPLIIMMINKSKQRTK